MKRFLLALGLCASLFGGAALAKEDRPAAPVYAVVDEDARIAFSDHTIVGYEVGEDRSLLIRAVGGHWYRATVWPPCAHDLRFGDHIGFVTRGTDTFDRFGEVIVEGNRCPVRTLDEIAAPVRRES